MLLCPRSSFISKMKVRTGRRTVYEWIIRFTVQCIADYKGSRNDLIGIIVTTANAVLGQNWSTASDLEESDNISELDNDSPGPDVLKRRCTCNDLTSMYHIQVQKRCVLKICIFKAQRF